MPDPYKFLKEMSLSEAVEFCEKNDGHVGNPVSGKPGRIRVYKYTPKDSEPDMRHVVEP